MKYLDPSFPSVTLKNEVVACLCIGNMLQFVIPYFQNISTLDLLSKSYFSARPTSSVMCPALAYHVLTCKLLQLLHGSNRFC